MFHMLKMTNYRLLRIETAEAAISQLQLSFQGNGQLPDSSPTLNPPLTIRTDFQQKSWKSCQMKRTP